MQKNILITGCSSGIGLVAAGYLHARGYRVIATYRNPKSRDTLQNLGFTPLQLDMDDENSIGAAINTVNELTEGRLFGLINNAGFGQYGQLEQITRRQLEQQLSTNLFGVHQLTIGLLPLLRQHGAARIINLSSVMGFIATPGRGAYAASKYALEAWSDTIRMELSGSDIRVCLIEPGPINTEFSQNVQQSDQAHPIKNPGIAAKFSLPPEALLPKIRHALESRSPNRRYPVTVVSHVMAIAKRILPTCLMDQILNKQPKN